MDPSNHKRSRKRLILCDSDSSSETEELKQLKYRKVLQKVAPTRNTSEKKVNILENVQICPPSKLENESDSDLENEFFPSRKKYKKFFCQPKQGSKVFVSPSTSKQYSVLESREIQNPEVSRSNPILLTPTQKFIQGNNYNQSRASSPDSLNIYGEMSRCSSLSDISFSKLLPAQISDENMQELLKTTSSSYTTSKKQVIKEKVFIHAFKDENAEKNNIHNSQTKDIEDNLDVHIIQKEKQKNQHQEQEEEQHEQEEKHLEQEEEHQEQEEEHNEHKEKHQEQEEERQEQEEEQVRQDYDREQFENDTEGESIMRADISTENSESDYTEEEEDDDDDEEDEASEGENELEDNQISETESNDNEDDGWIDISDNVGLDFHENTLDSIITLRLCNKLPIEIYSLFLTDEIINKIVRDTNKYAEKYFEDNQDNIKEKSRLKAWKSVEDQEMRSFFGVILVMGLNKVPNINDYWSKKSIYRNEYICSIISRDRFLILLKFWHFCDESIDNTGDKLYKVRKIHEMLNSRFQQVLCPGKIIVIDETMIPWRGRLKFRQYIRNKSHKYGVKLYKLCTPEGYTYNTIIYTGKEGNNREQDHGKKTVLRLITGLENEGRIVVADNFYSSIGLAEELIEKKTFYCGTLQPKRRGLPKKVISTKLRKGQVTGKINPNGVKIIKWCDKRPVLMLTTCKDHNAALVNTGKKRKVTNEDIKKPSCVLLYNAFKKGVDYSDQMSSYYTTLKRGVKWYRKVMAEFLFGTALVNAWIIYNMINTENKMPKKDFTESVIEALTGRSISERGFPSGICAKHALQKSSQRKRCVGCYDKLRLSLNSIEAAKKTKKIVTFCVQCDKSYCLPCFNAKHFDD